MADTPPSEQEEVEVTPAWGVLPVEQYLIRHWDHTSPSSADEQRRALIHRFLALNSTPPEYDAIIGGGKYEDNRTRVPTAEEVRDILAPWRSLHLRKVALEMWKNASAQYVILRTDYESESGDEKMREWIDIDSDCDGDFDEGHLWWRILNDPNVLNFGDGQCEKVFDILPELLGPIQRNSKFLSGEELEDKRRELREFVNHVKQNAPEAWQSNPEECIEDGTVCFHRSLVQMYFFVADKEAFETDKLGIVFVDGSGNILRHSRLRADEMWVMKGAWERASYLDGEWFNDGQIGDKYKVRGEIGRILYDVEDEVPSSSPRQVESNILE